MKKILYRILKKDIIKKLESKKYGTQFIDNVMVALDMPTTLTNDYIATLKQEHTTECFKPGDTFENSPREIDEI